MKELDALLRDPETHEALTRASDGQLVALRRAIEAKRARRNGGGELPAKIEGGYVSHGGRWFYADVDGIPSFLIEERIELDAPL